MVRKMLFWWFDRIIKKQRTIEQNNIWKKLKKVILDMYAIIKCAEDEDSIKIINLTYGTLTLLLKEVLDLN